MLGRASWSVILILAALSVLVEGSHAQNAGNPTLQQALEGHDATIKADLERFRQEASSAQQAIDDKLGSIEANVARCNGAWSQKLPAGQRFDLVLDEEAVLDVETCLVWERFPDELVTDWEDAVTRCFARETGGRLGWRLPSVEELSSLIDPSQNEPALPIGHPFLDVLDGSYWTATRVIGSDDFAWFVTFSGFGSGFAGKSFKEGGGLVWCVRGGKGYDAP